MNTPKPIDPMAKDWQHQTWEERCRGITRIYNKLVEVSQTVDKKLGATLAEVGDLRAVNARLGADLQAANLSITELGAEVAAGNAASLREVMRLRELLKENSIAIGG